MLKNILSVDGVTVLTKKQQQQILGGGEVCTVVCDDNKGSKVGTSSCDNKSLVCGDFAALSCSCAEAPNPLNPKGIVKNP